MRIYETSTRSYGGNGGTRCVQITKSQFARLYETRCRNISIATPVLINPRSNATRYFHSRQGAIPEGPRTCSAPLVAAGPRKSPQPEMSCHTPRRTVNHNADSPVQLCDVLCPLVSGLSLSMSAAQMHSIVRPFQNAFSYTVVLLCRKISGFEVHAIPHARGHEFLRGGRLPAFQVPQLRVQLEFSSLRNMKFVGKMNVCLDVILRNNESPTILRGLRINVHRKHDTRSMHEFGYGRGSTFDTRSK